MSYQQHRNGIESLPESLQDDHLTIVAGTDGTALTQAGMRLLIRYAEESDVAILLTTTMDAETGIDEYTSAGDPSNPDLAVIDTISTDQNLPSVYRSIPTVFTPAPGDVERTAMAVSELTAQLDGEGRPTHLLADSLSDIVEEVGAESALKLLRQATGPDAPISGHTFATVRYNAHSVSTVDDLTAFGDSVVWVENTDRGRELSYRRTDRIEELR